jgi:hypothetical protein
MEDMTPLELGLPRDHPQYNTQKYGIHDLQGGDPKSINKIFANSGRGDLPATRIFVFAPRPEFSFIQEWTIAKILSFTDRNDNEIPESVYLSSDASSAAGPAYKDRVKKVISLLQQRLSETNPNAIIDPPAEIIEYSPKVYTVAQANSDARGESRSTLLGDDNQLEPRGKILIQSQPAKCGTRNVASWRLRVEDRTSLEGRTASWTPFDDQWYVMDGAIPIEVSVLCVLRREENSRYRLLLVV